MANYCLENKNCTIDLSGTNGAELIDQSGNVIETLSADICTISVPKNCVVMVLFK